MKKRPVILVLLCAALASCQMVSLPWHRPEDRWDRVMIIYSAGFNDLSWALSSDQKELVDATKDPFIPRRSEKKALVAIVHLPEGSDYTKPTQPYIIQIHKDEMNGSTVTDTLYKAPAGASLTDKDTMRDLLEMVRDGFKSDHYGLIFESHGTGWLPEGYYNASLTGSGSGRKNAQGQVGFISINDVSAVPVRSYGDHFFYENGVRRSKQLEITDMAAAIPMHLDFLVFDSCLLGGIEVAYEFKDIADYIAFSPAEVLGSGMDYSKVAGRLLKPAVPDLEGLCRDFYEDYASSSVTTTLIRTDALPAIADVCRRLFNDYRAQLAAVDASRVQRYFRSDKHWFYDLRDILVKCHLSDADAQDLEEAMDRCIIYKNSTDSFLLYDKGFQITSYGGISMYLPCKGSPDLDLFYKGFAWNKATGLVPE